MPSPPASAKLLPPWRWSSPTVHLLLLLVLLGWAALECFGPLHSKGIAMSTHDRMQQSRLWASLPDPRLLIVDIDERSLADMAGEFGRWPWPRDTLATLLDHAQAEGAAALVFDILVSDPDRLHPGGDHALAAAVRDSRIGLYPVARLPAALDGHSEVAVDRLPGLAIAPRGGASAPQLAMIAPFMQAMVASGRLGTHTAQRDGDGKLRRFAFHERLAGGWRVRSMPAAVATHLGLPDDLGDSWRPVVWRAQVDAYPRVPFSLAWACAEGRRQADCPALQGRILVLGSTAASLHDMQATPLSNQHAAVDILATLIDNALHRRFYRELTPAWRFVLSAAALMLAWTFTRRGSAGATQSALFGLPLMLVALAYASLHSEAFYLDLMLPAGLALSFLSGVSAFDALRRRLLGRAADRAGGPMALACGSASDSAERLERALFDHAAREGLHISGGRSAAGDGGRCHALWVLWGLADAAAAQRASQSIERAVPRGWTRPFVVGAEPQDDLLRALGEGLPGACKAATAPQELLHAT